MRWLTFILLLSSSSSPARAADKLEGPEVQKLVQQLGSPSRRDREQAEARLIAGGPDTLKLLPSSVRDAAVSTAVDRIRRALEQEAARRTGLASTVSLTGRRSWQEVEKAFQDQTGQLVQAPPGIPPLDRPLDWSALPFWKAVHELEVQTGTTADADAGSETLVLKPKAPGDPKTVAASSGPCRIDVLGASVRPNLVNPALDILQVRWRVRTEPRLHPLYLVIADGDCSLTLGSMTFAPLSPDARREIPCNRWTGCEIDTAFQVPRNLEREKLRFGVKGELKVAALPLELRFDDLEAPAPMPQRRGAATGIVRNVSQDAASRMLFFDLVVAYERGGPEFESHRMWIYQNAAWLRSKSTGGRLMPDSVDLKEIAGTGATLGFAFGPLARPVTEYAFLYEAPSLVIDVPFSVDGLPLPSQQ